MKNSIGWKIEVNDIESIFKIDNNKTSKGTEGELGSGLGLTLCYEFVKLNNGEIWVDSEEGKGSVFTFSVLKNSIPK